MEYAIISQLADAGFLFAPASMGMTRSDRVGWPDIATNNKKTLIQWIRQGDNLVSVAKHGYGFAIDIDDIEAAKAMGFDPAWLDDYYLVDTPSGGLHGYGLHTPETEGLGTLVVVYAEKGNKQSKKIVELKMHNQSVAAPTAIRINQPKKKDGEYLPQGPFTGLKRGVCPEMLVWIGRFAEQPKVYTKGRSTRIDLHPAFSQETFLEHHDCTEDKSYEADGALWVVVEVCPLCGKEARKTTGPGGVTKFVLGGRSYGFVCHACGVDTKSEFEAKMAETYEDWTPWDEFIYRHEDKALVEQDILNDPNIELVDDCEIDEEPQTCGSDTNGFLYEPQDTGNGERLVRKFGHLIRWVAEANEWMVWGDKGWRPDTNGGLMRMSKQVVKDIIDDAKAEAADAFSSEGVDQVAVQNAKTMLRHAQNSGRIERRRAMIASAGYELGIMTNFNDWDANGWLLNCENGVIDLYTQTFRERTPADMCMKQSPVVYDADAKCPLWESAMHKWMCGDQQLVEYLQTTLGVTLTSDTGLQALFFNQGGGENGKDTMLNTVTYIMGGYWKHVDFMTFAEARNHSEHRNDLAALAGAVRMVTAAESSDGHSLDEGVVKQVTGCSPVTCRQIQGKPFTYAPQFKMWFMSNYEPVIKGNDWGIWRRVKKIPWNYTIKPEEKDSDFTIKLRQEAPGILNWMLAGLHTYLRLGKKLPPCKAVDDATAKYRKDMDIIGRFAEANLCFRPTATALGPEIYKAYVRWCKENGNLSLSSRRFFAEFRKRYTTLTERDVNWGKLFEGVGILIDGFYPDVEVV